jgi:hypothetical protein
MSENKAIFRGKHGDVFLSSNSVSGTVSETGETWDVSLAGTRQSVKEYVSVAANLFTGSAWSPAPLPSRNMPRISGWSVSYNGNAATLRISYKFDPLTTFFDSSDDLPPESKTESLSTSLVALPLQNCPGIWTKEQFAAKYDMARAIVVEYAKSRIAIRKSADNYDVLIAKWEANFEADMTQAVGETTEMPWGNEAYNRVFRLLCSGQDLYNSTAYQITITEKLNEKPELSGLNTYNTPPVEKLTLPTDRNASAWFQNGDSLTTTENGQFQRTRTWLGVSVKSPLYETLAEE